MPQKRTFNLQARSLPAKVTRRSTAGLAMQSDDRSDQFAFDLRLLTTSSSFVLSFPNFFDLNEPLVASSI
jgi:hypothetical protein